MAGKRTSISDLRGDSEIATISDMAILACPFCNQHNLLLISAEGEAYYVACGTCRATGPMAEHPAMAMHQWECLRLPGHAATQTTH